MSNPLNVPEYCDACERAHGPLDGCIAGDDEIERCPDCEEPIETGELICRERGVMRNAEAELEDWEQSPTWPGLNRAAEDDDIEF